jgi:MFS transporter, DHA1 family, multidrug resistance protein
MSSEKIVGKLGRVELIALITSLIAINAFAIDIMLPGIQQIGADLGEADPNRRQLIIAAYLLGFGVLQIVFGPLSDRFGRRKPLLLGIVVYLLAALGCMLVSDFDHLLAMRLLQGSGAAASAVIATAVVRDLFVGDQMAKTFSLVFMVLMVSPIVAPTLGQLIMAFLPWKAVFVAMFLVGAVVLVWVWLRLPETLRPEHRRPFTPKAVVEGFGIVFSNRIATAYIISSALMFSCLFGYLGSAQQIFTDSFNAGALFVPLFALCAACTSLGAFTNARFVARWGMRRLALGAVAVFVAGSLIMVVLGLAGWLNLAVFTALMAAIFFAFSSVGPNFGALALEPLGEVAGTAASAQGFLQLVIGAVLGAWIGQLYNGTPIPLALSFAALGLVAAAIVLLGDRRPLARLAVVHS